ncbi:hypothetical protein E2K66_26355, partial [Escherichia coli]
TRHNTYISIVLRHWSTRRLRIYISLYHPVFELFTFSPLNDTPTTDPPTATPPRALHDTLPLFPPLSYVSGSFTAGLPLVYPDWLAPDHLTVYWRVAVAF